MIYLYSKFDLYMGYLETGLNNIKGLKNHGDIAFAIGILSIIFILLFPIPSILIDLLLGISITLSIVILTTSLFISKSLEFNSFPSTLLISTMLRLSLNIASTRLILSHGHLGTSSAGHLIEAFGAFVMQGSVVIGIIVFAILTIINFIVITKGSGRIAEVSARFSLDAMPGKQMSIDADLNAGIIDEHEAKQRRKTLEDESSFFGAMDGASKFVRGDAIAGLLITFINFVAGIIIGVVQKNMSFDNALHTYTLLTIGDGLVSQIPALIVSIAAGLLVTKSNSDESAEKAVIGQLGQYPHALGITSILLLLSSAIPGIPAIPFIFLSTVTGSIAYYTHKTHKVQETEDQLSKTHQESQDLEQQTQNISDSLKIDSIRVEIGHTLLPMTKRDDEKNFLVQIKELRLQIAQELGFIMPSVRVVDNITLERDKYLIKIKDIQCAEGTIRPEKLLIINPSGSPIELSGEETIEPTFNIKAMWVDEHLHNRAVELGYTVVESSAVLLTHITETIKDNILELLTYTTTQELIENLSQEHKKLVADIIPTKVSISTIQQVLQNLLSERISIRDLPTIIEATAEKHAVTNNISLLTEHVRHKLARQISAKHANEQGILPVLMLSPKWEEEFVSNIVDKEQKLAMPPETLEEFITSCKTIFGTVITQGENPILLCTSHIRPYIKQIIERISNTIPVLAHQEIHSKIKIKNLGVI